MLVKKLSRAFIVTTILFALGLVGLMAASAMSKRPETLGITGGKLQSCGGLPNCVSSESIQGTEQRNSMPPIPYDCSPPEAMNRLIRIVAAMPRAKVVSQTSNYLHAEFASLVFRFTDDVEFRIDEADSVIRFRSASRIGISDLGVNRARMEEMARKFARGE